MTASRRCGSRRMALTKRGTPRCRGISTPPATSLISYGCSQRKCPLIHSKGKVRRIMKLLAIVLGALGLAVGPVRATLSDFLARFSGGIGADPVAGVVGPA